MKRTALLGALVLAGMLTACANVNVPPADYSDLETETAASGTADETVTEETTAAETTTTAAATTAADEPDAADETQGDTDGDAESDASDTAKVTKADAEWSAAYEKLLAQKNRASEHIDAYYALIRLDPDRVPELVVLDDTYMELYHIADGEAELLMEDAYKSSAIEDQNVCFQPIVGKLASYFTTMGGGTGFNIYVYETLDTLHVTRLCFDNNEDEGGELPYNTIWDSAEEYEVHNNGWQDVTLGSSWVHIGEDFEDIHELTDADAETLRTQWAEALGETDDAEDADD